MAHLRRSNPETIIIFNHFFHTAQATEDNVFFRKGEVLLVVVTRYALLDGDNVVRFTDTDNESCAAVYRTRGLLLLASEQ